jgi:hypothetical protein
MQQLYIVVSVILKAASLKDQAATLGWSIGSRNYRRLTLELSDELQRSKGETRDKWFLAQVSTKSGEIHDEPQIYPAPGV